MIAARTTVALTEGGMMSNTQSIGPGAGLELPYPWIMRNCISIHGVWMYPPDAASRLIALVRSGLLRLDEYKTTAFDLDHVNEAVAHAAANGGPFKLTVIRP